MVEDNLTGLGEDEIKAMGPGETNDSPENVEGE